MEGSTEDSVGGGAKGDCKVEYPVKAPKTTRRWKMQAGGAGLPHLHGCG